MKILTDITTVKEIICVKLHTGDKRTKGYKEVSTLVDTNKYDCVFKGFTLNTKDMSVDIIHALLTIISNDYKYNVIVKTFDGKTKVIEGLNGAWTLENLIYQIIVNNTKEDKVENEIIIPGESKETTIKMDIQLLATKGSVVQQAESKGYVGLTSCQANIVNQINYLGKDSITISGNEKTGEIPCISLPNIYLQGQLKNLISKYPNLLDNDRLSQLNTYMTQNSMCMNCTTCAKGCYNNPAYRMRPTKAIADLRSLYFLICCNDEFVGQVLQRTRNMKVVRLNASGELHNKLVLDTYIKIAKGNPTTKYFTYTKNYSLLEGVKLPKNLIINVSEFGQPVDMSKYSKNTNKFKTVTVEEFEATKENKTTKKCPGACTNCNYCYSKKGYTILCKVHGTDAKNVKGEI